MGNFYLEVYRDEEYGLPYWWNREQSIIQLSKETIHLDVVNS